MLKCLIAFILGWLVSRQMGDGFSVSCESVKPEPDCNKNIDDLIKIYYNENHPEYRGNEDFTARVREMYKTEKDLKNFKQCIDDNNPKPGVRDGQSELARIQAFLQWQDSHNYHRTTFKDIVDYWWHASLYN